MSQLLSGQVYKRWPTGAEPVLCNEMAGTIAHSTHSWRTTNHDPAQVICWKSHAVDACASVTSMRLVTERLLAICRAGACNQVMQSGVRLVAQPQHPQLLWQVAPLCYLLPSRSYSTFLPCMRQQLSRYEHTSSLKHKVSRPSPPQITRKTSMTAALH